MKVIVSWQHEDKRILHNRTQTFVFDPRRLKPSSLGISMRYALWVSDPFEPFPIEGRGFHGSETNTVSSRVS